MSFKWRVFGLAIFIGLTMSVFSIGGWALFYYNIRTEFFIGTSVYLFFGSLIFSAGFSIFLLWVLKNKFPGEFISNALQGWMYGLAILHFLNCIYFMIYGATYLKAFFNYKMPATNFIAFTKYLMIETIGLGIISVYLGINGLMLINEIIRNRQDAIRNVSQIGKQ